MSFPTCRGFPDGSDGKESTCNAGDTSLIPGLGISAGKGIGYPLQYTWASFLAQLVMNPPAVAGYLGSISSLGWSPGEGKGYPFQYSGLENSVKCVVRGITKSWTQLSNFHFPICSHLQVSFWESVLQELTEMVTPSALPTVLSTFNFLQYSLSHLKNWVASVFLAKPRIIQ